jgi:hypothetical protein
MIARASMVWNIKRERFHLCFERALSSMFRIVPFPIIPQKNVIEFHSEKTSGKAVGLRGS